MSTLLASRARSSSFCWSMASRSSITPSAVAGVASAVVSESGASGVAGRPGSLGVIWEGCVPWEGCVARSWSAHCCRVCGRSCVACRVRRCRSSLASAAASASRGSADPRCAEPADWTSAGSVRGRSGRRSCVARRVDRVGSAALASGRRMPAVRVVRPAPTPGSARARAARRARWVRLSQDHHGAARHCAACPDRGHSYSADHSGGLLHS